MLRIKLIDKKDITVLKAFCENKILGTKIICQINAYGLEKDFLSVWCCIDEKEKIYAVLSKFESNVTLIASDDFDLSDIRTFLDMISFDSLCCSFNLSQKLGYNITSNKNGYVYCGIYNGEKAEDLSEDFYKKSYSLICKSIPDSFVESEEAYLHFLSDFTYRKRRGFARIKGYAENGDVLSCALTSAETDNSAIISGVACDVGCRSTGLGKKTVLSLADELKSEGKSVYVIALNESAEGFYEHIGFCYKEKISFIERK